MELAMAMRLAQEWGDSKAQASVPWLEPTQTASKALDAVDKANS